MRLYQHAIGAVAATMLAFGSARAAAQGTRADPSLDHETGLAVAHLVDSARALHLPTDGLLGVAQEGTARHAPPARIVAAVRSYFTALVNGRRALGDAASDAEVSAAAGALLAGVSAEQVSGLRTAHGKRALTMPLVVLADLVARGVPADTAQRAVYLSVAAGLSDDDLAALRRYVEQDIRAGALPGAAAISRLGTMPGMTPADVRIRWRDHPLSPP